MLEVQGSSTRAAMYCSSYLGHTCRQQIVLHGRHVLEEPSGRQLVMYAVGYGAFLTAWGGTSWAKSLLKPVIQGLSYSLGHQVLIDNFMVQIPMN